MRRVTVFLFTLIAVPAALILVGCSSNNKSFTLKGSVSCNGKPLSSGVVRLHMADNRMAIAKIQTDGSFTATDVIPGEAKVTVEEDPAKKMQSMARPTAGTPQMSVPNAGAAAPLPIPAKYKDVSTTPLTRTLQASQPLTLELQ